MRVVVIYANDVQTYYPEASEGVEYCLTPAGATQIGRKGTDLVVQWRGESRPVIVVDSLPDNQDLNALNGLSTDDAIKSLLYCGYRAKAFSDHNGTFT